MADSKANIISRPATGSANPAQSLSSLWAYLTPALDHIVRSPSNNPDKAPTVDMEFYSGIHSACYNYITSCRQDRDSSNRDSHTSGTDLYEQLDRYFGGVAREIMLGAPQDDSTLIHYLVPCFTRYSAGAQSVNRLLNYVNRHYVKRAVDEDRGWLSIGDVLEHVAKTISINDTREQIATKMKQKRLQELKKWGYSEGASSEVLAQAEAAAEAASPPDRIVPIVSLAHRCFRIEVMDPLIATPKIKAKKVKNKIPKANTGPPPVKGRLARALKLLLESGADPEELAKLTTGLAKMLRVIGIRPDHSILKTLEKEAAAH